MEAKSRFRPSAERHLRLVDGVADASLASFSPMGVSTCGRKGGLSREGSFAARKDCASLVVGILGRLAKVMQAASK